MDQIVANMIEMEQQLRIWHWQTKMYSRHQAFGATYNALGELIDSFMEAYMGKNGRISAPGSIPLQDLNNEVESKIDSYIEFLNSLTETLEPRDTDLLNIRDEMLGLMNKLKYLLTLK
jgi:DNA-binding ferritin-like protein